MIIAVAIAAMLAMTACGSSDSVKSYETQPGVPEVPNTGGDALIVTNTGEGNVGMTYTKVADGSILVDCGDGGCGDVYSGNDMADSSDNSSASTDCPDGFVWCSIEKKCIPDGTHDHEDPATN